MRVKLIRSNSSGLFGTILNLQHHAAKLIPFMVELVASVESLGFDEWRMGTNIHVLRMADGRNIVLRPLHSEGLLKSVDNDAVGKDAVGRLDSGYIGIYAETTASSKTVAGEGLYLWSWYFDERNGLSAKNFMHLMRDFALKGAKEGDGVSYSVAPFDLSVGMAKLYARYSEDREGAYLLLKSLKSFDNSFASSDIVRALLNL